MAKEGLIPAEWCRTIGLTCRPRNLRKGKSRLKGAKLCRWVIRIPSLGTRLRPIQSLKSTKLFKRSPILDTSMQARSLKDLRLVITHSRTKARAIASLQGLHLRKCFVDPAQIPPIQAIHAGARRLPKPIACSLKWYSSIIAVLARRHAIHNHLSSLETAVLLGRASNSKTTSSIIQRNSQAWAPKPKRPFHSNSIRSELQRRTQQAPLRWKTLIWMWTYQPRLTGARMLDSRASGFASSHDMAA